MREKARAEGRAPGYDGTWRHRDPAEAPAGIEPAIRFMAPREGETVIEDRVQGRVVFANKELDDLVILRSDGTPTYNLSVVVDDHDMGITHVIRGDDHLTNAARQTQIFKALGWDTPVYAHVPLIHGPDGAKLSKRHGALGVDAYRAMGYLPAALRNYLVRLGWSHGDAEIMSTEDMVRWFDLDAIGRSAARFDFVKLENLERSLSARNAGRRDRGAAQGARPRTPGRGRASEADRRGRLAQTGARHAGTEGARQDPRRASRQCLLLVRDEAAFPRQRGAQTARPIGAGDACGHFAAARKRSSRGREPGLRPRSGTFPRRRGLSSEKWPSRSGRP